MVHSYLYEENTADTRRLQTVVGNIKLFHCESSLPPPDIKNDLLASTTIDF